MTIGFRNLFEVGANHFSRLFMEDDRALVAQMMRMVSLYPSYVNEEKNVDLMEEITLGEQNESIYSMQKDKSHGPDGWPMDFFTGSLKLFE